MEFRVLGPLEAWRGDGEVPLPAGRQRALLAALLLRANQVVTVQELIACVWGDAPPADARATTQTYIRRLRGALGAGLIHTRPDGYLLAVTADQVDLLRFEDLLDRARHAEDAVEEAALLADALALWRGPVLANVPSETLHRDVVPVLTERRLGALERRVELDLEAGRHADLVAELRPLIGEHPFRERFWAQLMTALAGCGRQAEALQAYQELRARLAEELGVSPSQQVQQAHLAVLAGDRELPVPAEEPARVRDATLGRAPTPMLLPADIPEFTGRADQLQALEDLLASSGQDDQQATAVVVLVITGTAGVGKTALAVHWAHRIADRFPDGQLHLDLRGYATTPPLRPIEGLAMLLRLLGVPPEQIPVDVAEAAALYRWLLACRRVLVVLDNAASVDQVRPLLPGSPGCLVVVTSRDRLGGLVARDGARRLTLEVLTAEEAHTLLVRILGEDRVGAEPRATAELARACAYLPLALRIAAANLTVHPHRGIAHHVAELTAGDRLAALQVPGDEDNAVRAAFDLSYQAIPAAARRLFRLLGLVPGPDVTPAAAAALTGSTSAQAQRLLERLAGAHLIGQHALGRYACHDLLRLYAQQRCAADDGEPDRDAALGRLLGWYLHAAADAASLLYPQMLRLPVPPAEVGLPPVGFDDLTAAMAWLEAERVNLVAAVQQAADQGPGPLAWLLADCLRGYFWLRRHTVDWLSVASAALAAAGREGDLQAQAAAQLSSGDLAQVVGDYPQAVEGYTAALALARQAGWADGQAAALGKLGRVRFLLGQLQQAAEDYAQALAVYRRTGRLAGQAAYLGELGAVQQELGRLQQAADHHAQALALYRELGSPGGQATAVSNLGMVDHDRGRLDQAMGHLIRALALHREVGDRYGEADTLDALAAVHRDAGRHTDALELAQAAVALAGDIGDRRIQAQAHNTAGSVHLRRGCPQQAIDHHRQALDLARQTGARAPETSAMLGLAAAHPHMGQHAQAISHASQALTLAGRTGHRVLEGQAHTTLGQIHLEEGQLDQATRHARRALAIHRETGHRLGEARSLAILGQIPRAAGDPEAAMLHWRAALELFADIGAPPPDDLRSADVSGKCGQGPAVG